VRVNRPIARHSWDRTVGRGATRRPGGGGRDRPCCVGGRQPGGG